MEFISAFFIKLSGWMRPHLLQISMAFVATLLVVYGNTINKAIKRHINHYSFFLRVTIFVTICAFGYGLIMVFTTPFLAKLLARLEKLYLSPVVILSFLAVGVLAERRNQI